MERVYPHDLEAERALLGAMLISKEACRDVINLATPDIFYSDQNRMIFEAMQSLDHQRKPIDVTTVTSYLIDMKELDKIGGVDYLLQLSESVPTTAHSTYYLQTLNDKALLRRVIGKANEIADKAYGEIEDVNDFVNDAEKEFLDVTRDRNAGEFKNVQEIVQDVTDRLVMLQQSGNSISGIKTDYYDLDRMTSGLQKGDLIIVAARPSVGKTAFALNIAFNVSKNAKEPTAIFSLEMPCEQLIQRIICATGSINSESLRNGSVLRENSDRYYAAADKVSKCNLYIDDTPGIKVGEIAAKCRRLQQDKGLELVIVDYLQLITGAGHNRENRQQEVSEISRQLKELARELNVPVIALSQLSRSVEKRDNKRPVLSDLRESGAIEQDADIVAFIHREDYQNPEKEKEVNGETEIIIAKHRNGPTGDVKLIFQKNYSKFSNKARADQEEAYGVRDVRV